VRQAPLTVQILATLAVAATGRLSAINGFSPRLTALVAMIGFAAGIEHHLRMRWNRKSD
jgi:hypothetical protein